ncbi:MAG: histidine kinase [Flavobacteriales bacterium]|nr:histidine kinase [Flavobacteriales bacterium]
MKSIVTALLLFISLSLWSNNYQTLIDSLLKAKPQAKNNYEKFKWNLHYARYQEVADSQYLYLSQAKKLADELKRDSCFGQLYSTRGGLSFYAGEYDSAVYYYSHSAIYNRKNNDSLKISENLFGIGSSLLQKKELENALDTLLLALEIRKKFNPETVGEVLNGIGLAFLYNTDYRNAEEYFSQFIQDYESRDLDVQQKTKLSYGYTNLGVCLMYTQRRDSGLHYFLKAYELRKEIGNRNLIFDAAYNLCLNYVNVEQYDNSLIFLAKLENEFSDILPEETKDYLINIKSFCYIGLERFEEGIALAREYIKKPHTDRLSQLSDHYVLMDEAFRKMGKYDSAHHYARKMIALKDTIYMGQLENQLIDSREKHEAEKKENENLLLRQEQLLKNAKIASQRGTIYAVVIGGLILIIAAVVLLYRNRIKMALTKSELEKTRIQAEKEAAVLEQKALTSQINTHFLFNTLAEAKSMVQKNKIEEAANCIAQTCKLIRVTLENATETKVTLEDEVECLRSYLELHQLMRKNDFKFEIKIDESIDPENILIPPMLVQPFLENSIVHGLGENTQKEGKIDLFFNAKGEHELECIIQDNGTTIAKKEFNPYKKKSLGVPITQARLANNNKERNIPFEIDIQRLISGTEVKFSIGMEPAF